MATTSDREPFVRVTSAVDRHERERLDEIAARSERTRSAELRRALRLYVAVRNVDLEEGDEREG